MTGTGTMRWPAPSDAHRASAGRGTATTTGIAGVVVLEGRQDSRHRASSSPRADTTRSQRSTVTHSPRAAGSGHRRALPPHDTVAVAFEQGLGEASLGGVGHLEQDPARWAAGVAS